MVQSCLVVVGLEVGIMIAKLAGLQNNGLKMDMNILFQKLFMLILFITTRFILKE